MQFKSFQMRILLWTWGLLLIVLAVVFFYSTSIVSSDVVEETERRSLSELNSIKWLIEEHSPFASEQEFAKWIDSLGLNLDARITYIEQGRVIADSEMPLIEIPTMDDHSQRPEVIDAVMEGLGSNIRYSDTLQKDMLYMAMKTSGTQGVPAGVVRIAVPFSKVNSRITMLRNNFIWVFLATLMCAALVSWMVSRSMSSEITAFSELAKGIGEGDYSRRLRALPGGEFKPLAESVNAMAQNIEDNVRIIEDQKGQLQAVFEGMREGVMTIDSEGQIESFNAALSVMFRLDEETIGRMPIEVTRRYEVQELVDSLLKEPDQGESTVQTELKDNRVMEVHGVPFFDHKGVRKVVLVFYDITEIKRGEQGLKNFVANASHQLRTPLTSIKGYTETLLDQPAEDLVNGRGFLEIVLKNADHMDKVISSMLALAKSEQMGKALNLAPVPARDVLTRAVNDVAPWADDKSVKLELVVPEGPMEVMAETDGLLHVFHNLLNNAIKYSPADTQITLSANEEADTILFCVEDEGPGIRREFSEKVFERFYRVDDNTIDGEGGSGLGLAICRRIVDNLDGEIWHDGYGQNNKGARFCFRLNKPSSTA